ncbi:MAG TPA: hypothetical protein VGG62_12240 [Terracidiphilus sp.]|jgi:predicted MFS family arabinose efflux permease
MKHMDRDLRQITIVCIILVIANIAAAIPNFRRHNWPVGYASLIWAANAAALLLHVRVIQHTRDEVRLILSLRSKIEEGEERS